MGDPLLEALTANLRGNETPTLSLRRGYVSAYDPGPPAAATITVGGMATGDLQSSYHLPSLKVVSVGSVVYWLQTGPGSGLVLGAAV